MREITLPLVPEALMSKESRQFWANASWPLGRCIHAFAWECRLANGGGPVDLQAQVSAAALRQIAALDADPLPEPWGATAAFIGEWARTPRSPVAALFVEMDEGGAPMLFPRIEVEERALWLLTAGTLLHRLSGAGAPGPVHRALIRAVGALPNGATPLYVAWLGARGIPAARLIASVPVSELSDYLMRISWPGDAGAVGREVQRLNPWSSHVPIGFDVGDNASTAVGVELHWSGPPRPGDRTHQALGQLAAWPELDAERVSAAGAWLDAEAPEVTPRLQLKLGFAPGGRTAKAYLGAWTEASANPTPRGGAGPGQPE